MTVSVLPHLLALPGQSIAGTAYVYRTLHDIEELLRPDYWRGVAKRLQVGDSVRLIEMDDDDGVLAITEVWVLAISPDLDVEMDAVSRRVVREREPQVAADDGPPENAPPAAVPRGRGVGRRPTGQKRPSRVKQSALDAAAAGALASADGKEH